LARISGVESGIIKIEWREIEYGLTGKIDSDN